MKKIYFTLLCSITAASVSAQSMTYSHDEPKMNQITVQEVGAGALTPDFYYLTHPNYKATASIKNKLFYRTEAGRYAYQQIDDAGKLDSALVKRAAIEVLNIADRTGGALDLAWGVEGSKIKDKLEAFEKNIGRIIQAGGSAQDQRYWQEQASLMKTAIKVIQDAYMPNSERKKQYLSIYADLAKKNESLVMYISRLSASMKVSDLLNSQSSNKPDNKAQIVADAMGRWRSAGWTVTCTNAN